MRPATHARGESTTPRRPSPWRLGTPLVVLLCGGLFVVSAENSDGTDLRPGRYNDLHSLVELEADRWRELDARVQSLSQEVEALAGSVDDRSIQRVQREAETLRDPAGLTARRGEGLSITLSDAPEELIDSTDKDPNLLVVHQQDIQAVVNALWKAGATAVTIEGQRVITTTGIKCEGSAVQLQGVPYPEPYEIAAVGDPDVLQAALNTDPYLAVYRAMAEDPEYGLGWDVEHEPVVVAPAYGSVPDFEFATVLGD